VACRSDPSSIVVWVKPSKFEWLPQSPQILDIRSTTMTKAAANPIPEGIHSLTPLLLCKGAADAIAFYEKAFGAVAMSRLPGPGGTLLHAMVRIGNSMLMLTDEVPQMGAQSPKTLGGSPVTIHLSVANAAATMRQAEAAGATVRMPVTDMFWGALYGLLEDPFGHSWSVATQVRDMSPQEIIAAMNAQFGAAAKQCN
jgi:PhnB protein